MFVPHRRIEDVLMRLPVGQPSFPQLQPDFLPLLMFDPRRAATCRQLYEDQAQHRLTRGVLLLQIFAVPLSSDWARGRGSNIANT